MKNKQRKVVVVTVLVAGVLFALDLGAPYKNFLALACLAAVIGTAAYIWLGVNSDAEADAIEGLLP